MVFKLVQSTWEEAQRRGGSRSIRGKRKTGLSVFIKSILIDHWEGYVTTNIAFAVKEPWNEGWC